MLKKYFVLIAFILIAMSISYNIALGDVIKSNNKIKTVFVGESFKDGLYYYTRGYEDKAYAKFAKSCEKGVNLGCVYAGKILGARIRKMLTLQLEYYGIACKNGLQSACGKLDKYVKVCVYVNKSKRPCLKVLENLKRGEFHFIHDLTTSHLSKSVNVHQHAIKTHINPVKYSSSHGLPVLPPPTHLQAKRDVNTYYKHKHLLKVTTIKKPTIKSVRNKKSVKMKTTARNNVHTAKNIVKTKNIAIKHNKPLNDSSAVLNENSIIISATKALLSDSLKVKVSKPNNDHTIINKKKNKQKVKQGKNSMPKIYREQYNVFWDLSNSKKKLKK